MKFGRGSSWDILDFVKDLEHLMNDALPMWDIEPDVQPADAFNGIPRVCSGWRFQGNEIFPRDFP